MLLSFDRKFFLDYFRKDNLTPFYVDPADMTFHQPHHKPKNLLFLYVESLESSWRTQEFYPEQPSARPILADIDALGGFSPERFATVQSITYSSNGLFASQCGFPTGRLIGLDMRGGRNLDVSFFPGAVCLGDLLHEAGYRQIVLIPHGKPFAGTGAVFSSHHYNVVDQAVLRTEGFADAPQDSVLEGYHDDVMLEQAYREIVKQRKSAQPYNINVFLADDHMPHGFPAPSCRADEKADGHRGAIICTQRMVAEFVQKLRREKLLDHTTVVIMGDHIMPIDRPEPRNVYLRLIDDSGLPQARREVVTHFDVFPSILDALHLLPAASPRVGFGASVFADVPDYNERLQMLQTGYLSRQSPVYLSSAVPRPQNRRPAEHIHDNH